ncbi:SUMF1/EgtB/PvdO family nonheme iron enzyme, partial [bacterium]|nr:SUMF1/EgtB/PvdO family nonheme iron enzyme [bacterium]
ARNSEADYWLPSENEWYKAAYYSPDGTYYDYATGTDTKPNNNTPANDTGNSANYDNDGYTLGGPYYSTEVGSYDESASPYGTYDQTGNVWEWNETLISSYYRGLRGGSWSSFANDLLSSYRSYIYFHGPTSEGSSIGFRVASSFAGDEGGAVPEPLSIGLVLLSVGGLVLRRAKRA